MPIFDYKARRSNGDAVTGSLEANSRDATVSRLQSQGLIPVSVVEQGSQKASIGEQLKKALASKKVPLTVLAMFSRQMYSLTKAGVPLNQSLISLIETTQSEPLREALRDILDGLSAGNDLATCLSRHPHIFNSLYISLVHVGENSGRLEEAFQRIAIYLELEQENAQRIKSALRYPVIVIGVLVVAFTLIMYFVIPELAGFFKSMTNDELPLATRILLGTSDFFVTYWWALLLGVVLSAVGFVQYKSTDQGALKWDQYKLKIPLFGDIIYRSLLARFARSFSMMSRSGVALTNALSVVARVVDNRYVGGFVLDMRNGVERGESVTLAAQRSQLFSPLVMQMLSVGENTGQMDEMLEEVADFYEREVDYDLKKIGDYIEPIMIVLVGIMVLILALGVFLPLWDAYASARG